MRTALVVCGLLMNVACDDPVARGVLVTPRKVKASIPDAAVVEAVTAPKLPPRAAGHGWFCAKNAVVDDMSTCTRTMEQCRGIRGHFEQAGGRYAPCWPQGKAACFTFHSILQDADSYDCSATIAACEAQRAHASDKMGKDVSHLSACRPVE